MMARHFIEPGEVQRFVRDAARLVVDDVTADLDAVIMCDGRVVRAHTLTLALPAGVEIVLKVTLDRVDLD